ncbi:MAG: hypothetical protein IJ209_03980, partial [Bacteroidaceae bacterium]|nr:hypothetical protein [Bacteroidaceae bacterium]
PLRVLRKTLKGSEPGISTSGCEALALLLVKNVKKWAYVGAASKKSAIFVEIFNETHENSIDRIRQDGPYD